MSTAERRRAAAPRSAARMRAAERKRLLLDWAKQLFAARGYRETSGEAIAAAAGVTEAVLYRHFESKKALLLEILQEVRKATLERWQGETAALTDPLARLHAVAELYFHATRELAVELRVLHRALLESEDSDVAPFLQALYLDAEAYLAQAITEGQQAGVFRRSLDPRVGAWELIRSALGYTLTLPLGIPLYDEPDFLPRAVECLLHCLLKTDV